MSYESYQFAPLSDFIRSSDRTPMTFKERQAASRPQSSSLLAPDRKTDRVADSVDLSNRRERVGEYIRSISTQLNAYSSTTLLNSIGSKSFGASGGLYSSVGQMPVSQMQSLIRKYA